ncbi:unnamed protein product [Linum trigynum]|uniref:Uncharacterized protein n=1 Tax=Linum trigynum TaxID=586398 RepID=A0AAV2F5R8_9ROSI
MGVNSSSFLGLLIAAAVLLVALNCSTTVLHLDKTPSVSVERHVAQDRARHARLFDGVANFPVYGSADPDLYG